MEDSYARQLVAAWNLSEEQSCAYYAVLDWLRDAGHIPSGKKPTLRRITLQDWAAEVATVDRH